MKKGFTLIELVMVIVILGILAALVIPKYVDLQKSAEESVVRSFGGALKSARDIYLSRYVIETGNPGTNINSFGWYVDYDGDLSTSARSSSTLLIDSSIRNLLTNSSATVGSNSDRRITFNLKSGATAVYDIDATTTVITETYTGF